MVIKRQRKRHPHHKQNRKNGLVAKVREQQAHKVDEQDKTFGGHDVSHDCADEESFFAFEDYTARVALVLEVERALRDRRAATDRALQFETATECEDDCARIAFHRIRLERLGVSTVPLLCFSSIGASYL
jgi:hypothetical protein